MGEPIRFFEVIRERDAVYIRRWPRYSLWQFIRFRPLPPESARILEWSLIWGWLAALLRNELRSPAKE